MTADPLGVRAGAAWVASRARLVVLDEAALADLALRLRGLDLRPTVDPAYFFLGSPAETAAYVLTFTAVNFGSGWHPHVAKLPGRSGSVTMMSRLTERFRREGPLPADELAAMTAGKAAALFGQPLDSPVGELMELFGRALSDLGHLLLRRYGGDPVALVEAAGGSAVRLAELLVEMELFNDVADYDGRPVPLLKRAQIASADLAAALDGHPLGQFSDLGDLTIFADNLVPHVLRVEGVLRYEDNLSAAIDAGELVPAGSQAEVEIRASAVHAVELLVEQLSDQDPAPTAAGIDYLLWSTGQTPRFKATPRHRTRTPYY